MTTTGQRKRGRPKAGEPDQGGDAKRRRPRPSDAAGLKPSGSGGVSSGLQPGGTTPAGGRRGGVGSVGTRGGSSPPRRGADAAGRPKGK